MKKFNAVEYLVDKYVDGEYAIIPVKLENKDDFFDQYDPIQTKLSPDVANYIDACSYNIPIKFKIKLDIICPDLNEETKEKMQDAVRNHYGLIVFDKNLDLRTNTYKTLWLLLCGIAFLAIVYSLEYSTTKLSIFVSGESILREVLLVTGWFFVWEAVENFVSNRRKLRVDKINNKQMFNAEIIFEKELSSVE